MTFTEVMRNLTDQLLRFLPKLLFALVILLIGHFIVKAMCKILNKTFEKFKLDPSLIGFFDKAANIGMHIILILSALSMVGISTTGLIAAFSACAVAISLALKDSLSNIASGMMLLISKPFSTGDYVEIGNDSGIVLKIDLMHTTLKTYDNRHVIIPNGQLATFEVTNYSLETNRRVDHTFSVSYENDTEEVKKAVMNCVKAEERVLWDEGMEPIVRIQSYGESAINFVSRVWVKTEDYWEVYYKLLEDVKHEFDRVGIVIPYNQLDVHLIKDEKTPS